MKIFYEIRFINFFMYRGVEETYTFIIINEPWMQRRYPKTSSHIFPLMFYPNLYNSNINN